MTDTPLSIVQDQSFLHFGGRNSFAPSGFWVILESMEGFPALKVRKIGAQEDWDAYWLSKSPAERIMAVGIINLTINGEKYAEQEFPRVCKIAKRTRS